MYELHNVQGAGLKQDKNTTGTQVMNVFFFFFIKTEIQNSNFKVVLWYYTLYISVLMEKKKTQKKKPNKKSNVCDLYPCEKYYDL